MTNLLSCLMYSSGLPMLYFVACLFYFILYWVYKFLLFKFYQTTSRFNEQLPIYFLWMIKFGLLFHMLIAGFMFTNSRILSSSNLEKIKNVSDKIKGYLDLMDNEYINLDRFSSFHGQLYLALFIIIILVYMFHTIVIEFVGKILISIICCKCFRKHKGGDTDNQLGVDSQSDFYKDLSLSELSEFYKRINKEYIKFKETFTTSRYNQEIISKKDCQTFLRRLE